MSTFDELVGRLPTPETIDAAVHPRVLTLPHGEGPDAPFSFAFVAFEDPGGPKALHEGLRPLVEAALLAELSDPDEGAAPDSLDFVCAVPVDGIDAALAAFGFAPAEPDAALEACMRGEASSVGRAVPDAFDSTWRTPVNPPVSPTIEAELQSLEWPMFGETPGALAKALGLGLDAPPTPLGLDQVEAALVSRTVGGLRWIPPRSFLALCDFVALVLARAFDREIQWAPSERDASTGMVRPPLVRMKTSTGWAHLPIGLHVLRWCVMPLQPGEDVPLLSHWCEDQARA